MRPLFTVHAGEYLVGSHIERAFPKLELWIPSRDTGVDLLVTNRSRRRSISLQVKFSRDFLVTHMKDVYQTKLRACGWWKFDRGRLARSLADYWVLTLVGFERRTFDYIVVPPKVLLERLESIHGRIPSFQSYFWVTAANRCFETRGLRETERLAVASGSFRNVVRNFSQYLNNWRCLRALSNQRGG